MPDGLSNWTSSSESVGRNFNNFQAIPIRGVDNGYALPDPNIIAGAAVTATRAGLFCTWLKLRDVCLYRMRSPSFRPLRSSQWRRILGLEVVGASTSSQTKASKDRAEMEALLQDCLVSGGMQVCYSYFESCLLAD